MLVSANTDDLDPHKVCTSNGTSTLISSCDPQGTDTQNTGTQKVFLFPVFYSKKHKNPRSIQRIDFILRILCQYACCTPSTCSIHTRRVELLRRLGAQCYLRKPAASCTLCICTQILLQLQLPLQTTSQRTCVEFSHLPKHENPQVNTGPAATRGSGVPFDHWCRMLCL